MLLIYPPAEGLRTFSSDSFFQRCFWTLDLTQCFHAKCCTFFTSSCRCFQGSILYYLFEVCVVWAVHVSKGYTRVVATGFACCRSLKMFLQFQLLLKGRLEVCFVDECRWFPLSCEQGWNIPEQECIQAMDCLRRRSLNLYLWRFHLWLIRQYEGLVTAPKVSETFSNPGLQASSFHPCTKCFTVHILHNF